MRIYTRIVLDMTKDDLPVIESEGFEYNGEVALCGRDSDASGGSANGGNGEGNGNEGRGGGGERGGGNGGERGVGNRSASRGGYGAEDSRGWGGGGLGGGGFGWGGEVGLNGPAPSTRSTAEIEKEINDRAMAKNMGYALSALGLAVPGIGWAGTALGLASRYGRSRSEETDMEKAAKANGMGEGERGTSSNDAGQSLADGLQYHISKSMQKEIDRLAAEDAKYKSVADKIAAAKEKSWTPGTTTSSGGTGTTTTPNTSYKDKAASILGRTDSTGTGLGVGAVSSIANPYKTFIAPRLSDGLNATTTTNS